jgi:flagellar biosynthesis/type III secretory pathway chaperone
MHSHAAVNQSAIQQLNNELVALREFVSLLASEQKSLLGNDAESLLKLSETKTQSANQLMDMAKSRREKLLANSKETMETWMSKHAPDKRPMWDEICKLAAEAQHLNSTNGELISSKMRNNQQTLNVLFNSPKNSAHLYGPDGQANINSSGRHLGSG